MIAMGEDVAGRLLQARYKALQKDAGVLVGPCGRDELDKFQLVLAPEYQIHVVYKAMGNQVRYRGDDKLFEGVENRESIKHLYLHHASAHYNVIKNVRAFFVKPQYCKICDNSHCQNRHTCQKICAGCKRKAAQCADAGERLECALCHRFFHSKACLRDHALKKNKWVKKLCRAKVRELREESGDEYEGGGVENEEEEDEGDEESDDECGEDDEEVDEDVSQQKPGVVQHYSVCERFQRCTKCCGVVDLKVRKPKKMFWRSMSMHRCGNDGAATAILFKWKTTYVMYKKRL